MFYEKFKFYGKFKLDEQFQLAHLPFGLLMGTIVLLSSGCTTAPPTSTAAPTPTPIPTTGGQSLPITATAKIANTVLQLEVANTPTEQSIGLMFRPALPDDRGMLFPMVPARRVAFWMKNVPVALDIVFLYQGKVVAVAAEVPSCRTEACPTYGPSGLVDEVLELRAGRAKELGLKPGDPIEISDLK